MNLAYNITPDSIERYIDLCHNLEATFLGTGGTTILSILGEFKVLLQEAVELVEFGLELWTHLQRFD
jgi:hypothetical protein